VNVSIIFILSKIIWKTQKIFFDQIIVGLSTFSFFYSCVQDILFSHYYKFIRRKLEFPIFPDKGLTGPFLKLLRIDLELLH